MEFQAGVDLKPFNLALPQVDTAVSVKTEIISTARLAKFTLFSQVANAHIIGL